jgi:hypothetical protein
VDHVPRLVPPEVLLAAPVILGDHLGDALDVPDDDLPLLVREVRGVLPGDDGPVGQEADHDLPQLAGLGDYVKVPGVDDIPDHGDVGEFRFHDNTATQLIAP